MRLKGLSVVVTRSRSQAAELSQRLIAEGAIVHEIPSIEIAAREEGLLLLKQELSRIREYSWLLLTSVNTVTFLDQTLHEIGKDWSIFAATKIACIGKATARKTEALGATVALVPPQFRAESLASELMKTDVTGKKLLLPRAAGSRRILPEQLAAAGATVQEIHIYQAESPEESKQHLTELFDSQKPDFITFTSSSTVRNFAELAENLPWQEIPVACIGPITAETLREYGIQPAVEADEFTIDGLVEAMIRHRAAAGNS